jgi:hypothetical protein
MHLRASLCLFNSAKSEPLLPQAKTFRDLFLGFYQYNLLPVDMVDLTEGPILVSVESMVRTMAVDWDSSKGNERSTCIILWSGKQKIG